MRQSFRGLLAVFGTAHCVPSVNSLPTPSDCRSTTSHGLSPADFEDFRRQTKLLEGIAGYDVISKTLTGDHEPERVEAASVSSEFFHILGVKPLLGTIFVKDQEVTGRDAVMLISHGMWKTRFGGDAGIIGRKVRLDGQEVQVIGVLPE